MIATLLGVPEGWSLEIDRLNVQTLLFHFVQAGGSDLAYIALAVRIEPVPAPVISPYTTRITNNRTGGRAYVLELGEETRLKFWILLANAKGGYSPGSSETILEQDLTALREGGADELVDRLRQPVGAWFFSEVRDSFHAEGEAARGRVGYIAAEPCLPPVCRGGRQTRFHGPRRHRGSMTRQVKSRPKPLSARLARILRWTLCVSRSRLAGNPHPKSGSTFLLFPGGKARKIVGW